MQNRVQTISANILGKLSQVIIRSLNLGKGRTAPGLIALKIDPEFVKHKLSKVKKRILIIGTNGKTTTTDIIANIFKRSKIDFLTNPTGSNLLRGVATSALCIKKNITHLLLEVDEAAIIQVAPQIKPTHILITNLFRDQLDRYGELNTIINKWLKLLNSLPRLTLIINADDPNLVLLASKLSKTHQIIYFGMDNSQNQQLLEDSADAIFCPKCQNLLKYTQISFSHLGHFACECGFVRPKVNFSLANIEYSCDLTSATFTSKKTNFKFTTSLLGSYNLYNCLASASLSISINLNLQTIKDSIINFTPTFGRQEIISTNDHDIHIFLVKNPAGFNQVLQTLNILNKPLTLGIMLNDNIADGTDISWIWDVDFEQINCKIDRIIIGGSRALDMAVRLKYSGFPDTGINVEQNINKFYQTLINQSTKDIYLLPTYTAMLKIREKLIKN